MVEPWPDSMTFGEAVRSVYGKWTTDGRALRSEYWWFQLFLLLVILATAGAVALLSSIDRSLALVPSIAFLIFILISLLPSIAVSVRRLHDSDKSGWWFLISLVPYIGGIIFLIFMVLPSTPGPNRYGPPYGQVGTQYRVQYTGWTPDDAMQAFAKDAQRAAAAGYQPYWQEWKPPHGALQVLEVSYGLAQPEPPWHFGPPAPPPTLG